MAAHPDLNHLADDDLLLALDRELPVSRQRDADAHLASCAACRARRDAIAEASLAAAAAYRDDFDASDDGTLARSRARLSANLAAAAERSERVWIARLLSPSSAPARWALAATAVAVAVLSVRLLSPAPRLNVHPSLGNGEGDALPRAALTPGAVSNISADELCAGIRHTRPIPASVRQQVLRDYRMEDVPDDQYELDYLITPELGGATDARNLWPQRYSSRTWNAHVKDELERLLPALVCARQLDLAAAQHDMAVDWIAAYRKYFKTQAPLRDHVRASRAGDDDDDTEDDYAVARRGWNVRRPMVRNERPASTQRPPAIQNAGL